MAKKNLSLYIFQNIAIFCMFSKLMRKDFAAKWLGSETAGNPCRCYYSSTNNQRDDTHPVKLCIPAPTVDRSEPIRITHFVGGQAISATTRTLPILRPNLQKVVFSFSILLCKNLDFFFNLGR